MKYLAALLLAAGCGGSATGSTCPTNNPPTYASFGQHFFATYCTGCHSATAANRHDAPGDQNYDTEAEIKAHADDIDQVAASGPAATNTSMPDLSGPVRMQPSLAERVQLGQFLACEKATP
jgi:uncharacterized membrane protein